MRAEHAQHGQLCADGLARARRRAQQHILIGVVERVERLRQQSLDCDGMLYQPHGACRVAARCGKAASQEELCAAATHLRLDGVEVGEAVQRLERRAVQRRQRQRVQVQQLGVRRVPLRQDQALEGDRQQRLRAQPVVRDGSAQARSTTC